MSIILSKRPTLDGLAHTVKAARARKGWSQRELGARAGLAQSQISKIENAEVDPLVSTLMELARSLDLDLRLVPRTALNAVETVVRETEERAGERDIRRRIASLIDLLPAQGSDPDNEQALAELRDGIEALKLIAPLLDTKVAVYVLGQSVERLTALCRSNDGAAPTRELRDLRRNLQTLRNTHVHTVGARPAYSLDDED